MKELTRGNPLKLILLMSLPIMVGNLFQQLYSTVDAVVVGRFLGSNALAAVGATSSIFNMMMWFVMEMSGGFAVVIAQHFGAGRKELIRSDVCIALELATGITLFVSICGLVGSRFFLTWMNTPDEIFKDSVVYLSVTAAGLIVTMFYNICAAILRALGDSKTPFVFVIISSIINIVLDIVFIRFFQMGVFGAAFATVISQAISGVACAVHMYRHFEILRIRKGDWAFEPVRAKQMLGYGIPAGMSGVTTAIGIIILQAAINMYGTIIIASYTAAIRVQNLIGVPYNAFSTTMVNYSGQNLGAGKVDRLGKGYAQCMTMALGLSVILGCVLAFWGGSIASLFVDTAESGAILEFASVFL